MSNFEVFHFCGSTFDIQYSEFFIRTRGKCVLPYLSNCYCLTGRAGESPYGLGDADLVSAKPTAFSRGRLESGECAALVKIDR
jgi:hypothetical protein